MDVGGEVGESWGRGERFGFCPIGFGEVYWFAVANRPAGGRDGADSLGALLDRFRTWHAPIPALLRATDPADVLRTDIHDRPPVRSWTRGRVALLGDAAHPMTPNLGQGGCQAVEDAVALALLLSASRDHVRAFRHYERIRLKRANRMVEAARRIGRVGQASTVVGTWLRDAMFRAVPAGLSYRGVVDLQRPSFR